MRCSKENAFAFLSRNNRSLFASLSTPRNTPVFFFFNRDNNDIVGNNSSTDAAIPFSVSRVRWLDERRGCFAFCQEKLPQSNGGDILPRETLRKFALSYLCPELVGRSWPSTFLLSLQSLSPFLPWWTLFPSPDCHTSSNYISAWNIGLHLLNFEWECNGILRNSQLRSRNLLCGFDSR